MSDPAPVWSWLESPPPHLRDYAETVWRRETLADFARARAAEAPGFVAYIDEKRALTRLELVAEAEALAAALGARGIGAGDVVAFQLPNWHEAAVINLAAAMLGAVVNPIVPIYRDAEVGQMLGDCGARALFTCTAFRRFDFAAMAARLADRLPRLDHVIAVRGEGRDAYSALVAEGAALIAGGAAPTLPGSDGFAAKMILYTSGTTGRPKGVLHAQATIGHVVRESFAHWGVAPGDTLLMPSPVTHISGYANGLEAPILCGTRTILMESWDAAAAVDLIEAHGVAGTVAATPFLVELADAARATGKRLPSLRFFACGGAAVPADLIPAARAAFAHCQPFRVFGASEVPLVSMGWPGDPDRAATTDGEVVDYAVRIVDADNRPLPPGREGEILARGAAMMLGYSDADQTRAALTDDGFFRTGDLGILTVDGALTVTGRKKDLIIRGGENISAAEIEDVLRSHPAVRDVAVVAMPHPRLGEGVCAYVMAAGDPPAADALVAHVAASGLARQKIPERFEFVDEFPRTASGKVRKDRLREDVRDKVGAAA